jgi:hypothetical protein
LKLTAAAVINSTAASNASNSSRSKRLSGGAIGLHVYTNIPDMEVFYNFKLKEGEYAQTLPNAICPFRYLPYSDELAPLSGRRVSIMFNLVDQRD